MSRKHKLLKKVLSASRNVRFDDLRVLMIALGFRLDRITGSHHIFINPGVPQAVSLQPDQNGQAKPYQLKQLTKLIEKYNLQLETDSEGELSKDDDS
jgi:predicted RNA binding protein YcfA (HicA-like mRNA interferase family)